MRPFLHVVSLLLVLPGLALALAFVILGRVIAAGSLLGMLDQVLTAAIWLVPWGLLAIFASLLAVAIGGLFVRTRWLAGLCVALLAVGSTLLLLVVTVGNGNFSADQVPFLGPGVIAGCIGTWLALRERPSAEGPGSRDHGAA